ncbi:MAG: FAD:protein FMN transferase, partial [Clostridia bacterium]|nr:FAD:protein FMN transferase [Clostridia bacterium]
CVYRYNEAQPGDTVEIDKYTHDLLLEAVDLCGATDGYYNPAVYYSVTAYGFGEQEDAEDGDSSAYPETAEDLPSAAEVAAYQDLAAYYEDHPDEMKPFAKTDEDGVERYYITKPEKIVEVNGETLSMKIDLGGIGKGYATDFVSDLIDQYNVKYPGDFRYGYFTFGSSSMAVKKFYNSDDGSENYTIGLTNPRDTSDAFAQFTGKDLVLSTSGDYEQYYKIDGKVYCHIINPKTGMPIDTGTDDVISTNVVTVTIAGGSAVEDDAYTTALMAMGGQQAIDFINGSEYLKDKQIVMVVNYNGRYAVISNIDSLEIESEIEGELE